MKRFILTSMLSIAAFTVSAQITNIPDPAFEEALINMNIDSDEEINGQILTSDIENITLLSLDATLYGSLFNLNSLTGIEAFTSLQKLSIYFTPITTVDISQNTQLKSFTCRNNMLESLDLSSNTLLEELNLGNVSDLEPHNPITQIDLSNNPAIKKIFTEDSSITYINLKNNNNNPDMMIDIGFYPFMPNPDNEGEIYHTVCIEVDNPELAQSNQLPYSEWEIYDSYAAYNYSENCTLKTVDFDKKAISVYPNPTLDVLYFQSSDSRTVDKVTLFDLSGRIVKEYNNINSSVSISDLQTGTYIIKLVFDRETFTQKIIKK